MWCTQYKLARYVIKVFVHHNGHEKTKETSDLKNCWFQKRIEKASDEKVWKQGKRSLQIVWKRVRDGAAGPLKSEMELEGH